MKRLLVLIGLLVGGLVCIPGGSAQAQCNGQFGAGQVCGSVAGGLPGPVNLGGSPTVFNVKSAPCNATGNGSTDDTAAINTCIANFNAAGNGILYFPAGTYKTTAALTAITANGIIKGDGQSNLIGQIGSVSPNFTGTIQPATVIQETSGSVAEFSVTGSQALIFQDLSIQNTSVGAPVSGSVGILVNSGIQLTATANTATSSPTLTFASVPNTVVAGMGVNDATTGKLVGTVQSVSSPTVTLTANASNAVSTNDVINFGGIIGQKVDYQNVTISGFYIDVDVKSGAFWSMQNTVLNGPVLYGIRINNVVNTDAGDWAISNSQFITVGPGGAYSGATSAIRIEGSGGGKITNSKINTGINNATGFTNGIDLVGNGTTSDLLVSNCSIENFTGYGILMAGNWFNINITGIQFASGAGISAIKATSNRNVVINGITLSGTFSGPGIDFGSAGGILQDSSVTQVTYNTNNGTTFGGNLILSSGGIQNNAATNDITGTIMGEGLGVMVNGAPTAGTSFPGSLGVSSNGRTEFWIQGGGGAIQALTFGAPGPIWKFINDASNIMRINRNGVGDIMVISNTGHVAITGGTAPTLTAGCNGAGSVVSGNDADGTITGQTAAATTCTLSFGTAYAAAPNCAITGLSSPLTGAVTVGTGSIVVNFASTANYKWSYICHGT